VALVEGRGAREVTVTMEGREAKEVTVTMTAGGRQWVRRCNVNGSKGGAER